MSLFGGRRVMAAPFVGATVVLGAIMAVKVRLFLSLEYSWDLFVALQMSRSWLTGRPLLWENRWGHASVSHNYFLTPVLGLLTQFWGVYGLFVAHGLMILLAFLELQRLLRPLPALLRYACIATYLFGPVGFWIWDDPFYGWHAEALYVPLAVLFAGALIRRRKVFLWGAALVLLREDGAVVACAIHLLHTWLPGPEQLGWRPGLKRTLRIAAAWLFVFCAGLLVQRAVTPQATSRLEHTIGVQRTTGIEASAILARDLAGTAVLFGSGLLIAQARTRARALAASLPVVAVALVACLAYDARGMVEHGPSWVPRFAMLWGIAGAALAFSCPAPGGSDQGPDPRTRTLWWASLGVSVILQFAALALHKDYVVTTRLAQAVPGSANVLSARLGNQERSFLACLSQRLPESTVVAAHARLFAYFHRHDTVWASYPENSWFRPQVVVCESRGKLPQDRGCPRLQASVEAAGFLSKSVRAIRVDYDPLLAPLIGSCASVALAGRHQIIETGRSDQPAGPAAWGLLARLGDT